MSFLGRIRRNRLAFLGAMILSVLVAFALLTPLVVAGDPNLMRPTLKSLPPSWSYWFGTDQLGRDLFLRVMHGSRLSLGISLAVALISLIVGTTLGIVAGYVGGWVDTVIGRIVDSLMAFPSILLALGVMAMLGASLENVIVALSLVYMPRVARVARAPVLAERKLEYVEAARSGGASHARILFRHILPNVTSPIIVQATVVFAYAMVAEATLGFLGVGVPPPEPSWGNLLADGRRTLMVSPEQTIFPALALGLTVLGINLLGDGLRDVLDPRMRGIGTNPTTG
ncbi:MAG: ABC transporter permease [Alphaproteobacteria bacterium]|nr:ABC transporter permease [Alphaproteobacteria bacterium]